MAGVLFEDIFDVKDIDPEGKKFDRGESSLRVLIFYAYGTIYKFFYTKPTQFKVAKWFVSTEILENETTVVFVVFLGDQCYLKSTNKIMLNKKTMRMTT